RPGFATMARNPPRTWSKSTRRSARRPLALPPARPIATRMPVSGGYDLYYWPSIQGRGEFVRLALEQAGVAYVDVARQPESEGGGVRALMQCLRQGAAPAPFAPPFLRHGEL